MSSEKMVTERVIKKKIMKRKRAGDGMPVRKWRQKQCVVVTNADVFHIYCPI